MSLPFMQNVTPFELNQLEQNGYSDEDAITLASGLLMDAVPCLEAVYATLPSYDQKAAEFAVLEMAKYIKIDYFNFERSTSPFSSETIGAYSYSKMQSNTQGNVYGKVPAFDRAVSRLAAKCEADAGINSATSEQVFKPGFDDYRARREQRVTSQVWWS